MRVPATSLDIPAPPCYQFATGVEDPDPSRRIRGHLYLSPVLPCIAST